jgi:Fic family protein
MNMKPYNPIDLPVKNLDYKHLFCFIGEARAHLARYDGLLQGIVNPDIMLSPLTNEEAVLSSKIEGTQATVDEVLEHEAGLLKEGKKYDDIQEIVNYRKALISGHKYLADKPITLYFVRELHKILLNSVRGEDKSPGQFRKDQNWIGDKGCPIEQATFVPPNPIQLQNYLENWQLYLESDDIDALLQSAVVHAQFELLHPFSDGNGRIGRILIPLFLYQKKILHRPMFYLSGYMEKNRDVYYHKLRNISQDNDWDGWIEFFLTAVIEQAKINCDKVRSIMELYGQMKDKISETTHSKYTINLLDSIFDKPIFETTDFISRSNIPKKTGLSLLKQLQNVGVLKALRLPSGRRPAILCFPELLNVAEGKKIL